MQRVAKHFACAVGLLTLAARARCFATRCMTLYLGLTQVPEHEAIAYFEHFTQYNLLFYNILFTIKYENDSVNKRLIQDDNGTGESYF